MNRAKIGEIRNIEGDIIDEIFALLEEDALLRENARSTL